MSDVSLLGSYGGAGGGSVSFRNILINGEVSRINQRGFDGNWAGKSVGEYGYDRWKKADASNISQVVEEGNFVPDAEYVLSGTGVTTEVLTAPSSGNWTITVPNTASYVQLERGNSPSPFEHRPIGMELQLCKRYYEKIIGSAYFLSGRTNGSTVANFAVSMPEQSTKRAACNLTLAGGTAYVSGVGARTIVAGTYALSSSGGYFVVDLTAAAGASSVPLVCSFDTAQLDAEL